MSAAAANKGRAGVRVSEKNRLILWTRAAGRCQYEGCNEPLLGDIVSGREKLNKAYIAHIVAAAPDGPRGDLARSALLANSVDNLMLLCDPHHRLIDREDVPGHPEARLLGMKQAHEERIAMVTAIAADRGTHILHYAARIGEHDCLVSPAMSKAAVLPDRYPLQAPISLEVIGSDYRDSEAQYWTLQVENLRRQFALKIGERLRSGEMRHVSVFAIGPQPLLIELGRLLGDIADVDVRQISREPRGWAWREGRPEILFRTRRAGARGAAQVALNLGVSAQIADERIAAVRGADCPVWAIEAAEPGNDILASPACLARFRTLLREAFAEIRREHGSEAEIHLFPALPVAMAVEVGRVWMPKADLPLTIHDEHRELGGFHARHHIEGARQA